jgi:hypothetical protein
MSIKFKDILEDILPDIYGDEDEAKRKKVIRKGKMKKKLFCKPGQKAVGNRCVTMKSKEKTKRKLKAKKGAIKRKSKAARIKKKMKKSLKKRKTFGLK